MSIFTRGCGLPPRLFFRAVLFWFALFRANKKAGEQKMPRRLSAALYCKTLQTMSLSCGEFRFAFANPAAHPHSKLKAYTQETFPDASAPRNLSIRTTDVLFRRSNNEPTREKASHQRISENSRVPVPAQALPFSRHFIIAPGLFRWPLAAASSGGLCPGNVIPCVYLNISKKGSCFLQFQFYATLPVLSGSV